MENILMDFEFKATYNREDFDAFFFALPRKWGNRVLSVLKIVAYLFAILFWITAARVLFAAFIGYTIIESFQMVLVTIPFVLLITLGGFWFFRKAKVGFSGHAMWKAYSDKGKELLYSFHKEYFIGAQSGKELKSKYDTVVLLREDKNAFYLFTAPIMAHIIPKRVLQHNIDTFRTYIEAATSLKTEEVHQ